MRRPSRRPEPSPEGRSVRQHVVGFRRGRRTPSHRACCRGEGDDRSRPAFRLGATSQLPRAWPVPRARTEVLAVLPADVHVQSDCRGIGRRTGRGRSGVPRGRPRRTHALSRCPAPAWSEAGRDGPDRPSGPPTGGMALRSDAAAAVRRRARSARPGRSLRGCTSVGLTTSRCGVESRSGGLGGSVGSGRLSARGAVHGVGPGQRRSCGTAGDPVRGGRCGALLRATRLAPRWRVRRS